MSSRPRHRLRPAAPDTHGRLAALAGYATAGALLLSGCNVAGAKAYNLRQLHDDRGRHVRVAQTMSDFRYLLNSELSGSAVTIGSADPQDSAVKDPLKECVGTLNDLGEMKGDDPRVAAVQIQLFAWLAVDDPWQISRTASVRQLGDHGARLGIEIVPRSDTPPATVEEVRDTLAQLVRAVRIEMGQEEGEPGVALAAACQRVDDLDLDRDGALRLLRAVAALEKGTPRRNTDWQPLRDTMELLERVCVREALLLALRDAPPRAAGGSHPGWNSPRVRAMAVTACIRSFGPKALGEMLLQLDREREPLVLMAVLRQVSRHGLPTDFPGVDEATLEGLHQRWTVLIVQRATQDPNGSVRVAAMRALETISGGELSSLREEDWLAWLRDQAGFSPGPEPGPAAPSPPERAAPPAGSAGEQTR